MLGAERRAGHVDDRPKRLRHEKALVLVDVAHTEPGAVQHASAGSALAKARRNREMNIRWHDVSQPMEGQGGVVGDDGQGAAVTIATPKSPADQVFVVGVWKVGIAVEAAFDREPVAALAVKVLLSVAVACPSGLGGREVATL